MSELSNALGGGSVNKAGESPPLTVLVLFPAVPVAQGAGSRGEFTLCPGPALSPAPKHIDWNEPPVEQMAPTLGETRTRGAGGGAEKFSDILETYIF